MIHVAKFLYLSIFLIPSARFIRFYDYLPLYVAACFILFMPTNFNSFCCLYLILLRELMLAAEIEQQCLCAIYF
jgi:hypothetical protein